MARGLKFRTLEVEGLYYLCSENKGADPAKLICVFVFAYSKCQFSHDAAQIKPAMGRILRPPQGTKQAAVVTHKNKKLKSFKSKTKHS